MPRPVCRFHYLYRDASNYKGYGSLLLLGEATVENEAAIRAVLIDGLYFAAERVGVPTLYHLVRGDSAADEDEDHGWHEFGGLRRCRAGNHEMTAEVTFSGMVSRLSEATDT